MYGSIRPSDRQEEHIPVHVLEAVVPEQHAMLLRDLQHPLHGQRGHLLEMPTKSVEDIGTYRLPAGTNRGLISFALNAAKSNSTGLAE